MDTTKHSIWILPEKREIYDKIIKALSKEYDGPSFQPHMTLIGDIEDGDVMQRCEILSKKLKQFSINIEKVSYMDDYWRCIIALARQENVLIDAGKAATEHFNIFNSREFIPHISLFYGMLGEGIKKEIYKRYEGFSDSFEVKKLCLVTAGPDPKEWKIIKEFLLQKA